MKTAVKFINKDWEKINLWWNSNKIQALRKLYLSKYYNVDYNRKDKWNSFLRNEINLLSDYRRN